MSRPAASIDRVRRLQAAGSLIQGRIGATWRLEWAAVTDWCAIATFPDGAEVEVTHGRSAADALEGLAVMLTENAICNRCARLMVLDGLGDNLRAVLVTEPCRWTRRGVAWLSPHED